MKLTIKQKRFADEYIICGNATESVNTSNLYNDSYGVVYVINNMINSKRYIGVTTRSINQRFDEHCKAKSYIGRAIRKLDRRYLVSLLETRLVTCDEIRHYASQKISSFEAVKT